MNILDSIRKRKAAKAIAAFMAVNILFQVISPSVSYALTSGPGQEEFASFEPAATSDMVDISSGDFTYNIPLLSVPGPNGGYPINLAYHSGVGMDQEASWVGLGWSLNVGAINRQMRGLPDDFRGERIKKKMHMKDNVTAGLDFPRQNFEYAEEFGMDRTVYPNVNYQVYYNTYKGLGYKVMTDLPPKKENSDKNFSAGVGLSFDSQNGIGIEPHLTLKKEHADADAFVSRGWKLNGKLHFNSRQGVTGASFAFDRQNGNKNVDKARLGMRNTSSISFNTKFHVPTVGIPIKTNSFNFDAKIGKADKNYGHFNAKFPGMWSGYVSYSVVDNDGEDNRLAYGYLNTDKASNESLTDFTRDNLEYSKKVPYLASSSFTYDVFNQTGQGTGSMFRPYYSGVPILSTPAVHSPNKSFEINGEFGTGVDPIVSTINYTHVGIGATLSYGGNSSGGWGKTGQAEDIDNGLIDLKDRKNVTGNDPIEEPYYFQVYGEKTGVLVGDDQLESWGGDDAIRVNLRKSDDNNWFNRQFAAENKFVKHQGGAQVATVANNNQYRKPRQRRATNIEMLTNTEAGIYGYSKSLKYNDVNHGPNQGKAYNLPGLANHMSEYSVLQSDGMRYIYGLPVYNTKQVEAAFVVPNAADFNTLTTPVPTQNGLDIDANGIQDEFLSRTEIPAYVHSWLLSSVVSADYVDLTGDGPTEDDMGYWVKFNYKKTADNYQWRVPYSDANFMEGKKYDPTDNRGSFTYGTKELYYLESIETKTHIAIFNTSPRADAIEAKNEIEGGLLSSGIQNYMKMYRLDRIDLYSKKDYAVNANPTRIKSVHFKYSYDLCPNVPNNDPNAQELVTEIINGIPTQVNKNAKHGKLTLEKLYFTYQNSTRGELSPYVFNYGNVNSAGDNPAYNPKNMDRWGNYKNNDTYINNSSNRYPYVDLPYTEQESGPPNVAVWSLKKIELPSGGTLQIEYEPDDYAYVENRNATRMFDILGLGEDCPILPVASPMCIGSGQAAGYNINSSRTNNNEVLAFTEARVVEPGPQSDPTNDNRVYFKLEQSLTSDDKNHIHGHYLKGLTDEYVYFKVYADLKNKNYPYHKDYVEGYAKVSLGSTSHYGAIESVPGSGIYDIGYLTLVPVPLNRVNATGIKLNPITKAAIEHLRANRPELIYDHQVPYSTNPVAQLGNLLGSVSVIHQEMWSTILGFNLWAFQNGYGQKIDLNGRSVIRLCDPNGKKFGGGVRVHKLVLNDNWDSDSNSATSEKYTYGQEYVYETTNANGEVISSGVAYEPQIGGDESALRVPVPYTESTFLGGSYHLYVERPVMENYYPGPSVIYSKVTVKSIAPKNALAESATVGVSNPLSRTAAPITVYEFYTAKDFPVFFDETDMNPDPAITRPIFIPGIFSNFKKRKARSQGYSIILNDMNGKLRSVSQKVASTGKEISRTEYIYNTDKDGRLSSKVQVLTSAGTYQTASIGQSHDIFIDMHENLQKNNSWGVNLNFDLAVLPPSSVPPFLFFIMPLGYHSSTETSMRTVVTNKIIHRTGILKEVRVTQDGSAIRTENLAYDPETGVPLLTRTINEFKDPVYNYNYPAHWYYTNMSGAYKNSGVLLKPATPITVQANGKISITQPLIGSGKTAHDYFTEGDLVYIDVAAQGDNEYHVYIVGNNYIYCIDKNGNYLPGGSSIVSIKVIRSGYRNRQDLSVGALIAKNANFTPLNHNDLTNTQFNTANVQNYSLDQIVDAAAIEYHDEWQVFCGTEAGTETECVCTKTQAGIDIGPFLNSLAAGNKLTSSNTLIYDGPSTYYYNFTSALRPTVNGPNSDWFWTGTVSGTTLTGMLDPEADLSGGCYYYLNLPQGYNWSDVQGITNVALFNDNVAYCDNPTQSFTATAHVYRSYPIPVLIPVQITGSTTCYSLGNCLPQAVPAVTCGIAPGSSVNPYAVGMKGIWRPKRSYAFVTGRTQTNDVRNDGIYDGTFAPFTWANPTAKDPRWVENATITKYSPYGFELENKNALGVYSAALYGYKNSLVTAIGTNSQYRELANDNFEDYPGDCNNDHFRFNGYTANIVTNEAHTGTHSLKVPQGNAPVTISKPIVNINCENTDLVQQAEPRDPGGLENPDVAHVAGDCDCIGKFSPTPDKKYVLSVWVKEAFSHSAVPENYTLPQVKVEFMNGASPVGPVYTLTTMGSNNIIEGWQRIFQTFDVPATATEIKVSLLNTATGSPQRDVYFDDIRIHPYESNMVTHVYDQVTLKHTASLDENNYATFYIYDEEGQLIKIKQETSEGIKTVKEGRISNVIK